MTNENRPPDDAVGVGSVLAGQYELLKELGRGGLGAVYLALDRQVGDQVAVKVLHPDLVNNDLALESLREDVLLARKLSSDNVVRVYSLEEHGDRRFVTMEYVEGLDIARLLAREPTGRLPLERVLQLAPSMCAGLDYAHRHNIIHADVKPQNFLLTEDATVKITDFGLGFLVREPRGKARPPRKRGTPAYMSPEQLSSQELDWRTDIFSLGVTFYEMLAGTPPFGDDPLEQTRRKTLSGLPEVPAHVNEALQRAMAPAPSERWPLASDLLDAMTGNLTPRRTGALPVKLTSFIGREEELERLLAIVVQERRRLVTLVGPAGSGKTRLVIEAARRMSDAFEGRVWFVPLQDLEDAAQLPHAMLGALGLAHTAHEDTIERVAAVLPKGRCLLVLDNFERLVDRGAVMVKQLLAEAPSLSCLATSRIALSIRGEREFTVGPLPVPSGTETPEELMRLPSVRLFVERAQGANSAFRLTGQVAPAVAGLTRELDGIPLALELAAAQAHVMTPQEMLRQLGRRFEFLVGHTVDTTAHHRSLRAALDWSYELLSPELRGLFAELSVFQGGWSARAAEVVCEDPDALGHLGELRRSSMVQAEEHAALGVMRFRMLRSLREYAAGRLPAGREGALRERHAEFCLSLVDELAGAGKADERSSALLELDRENLRAAREWLGSVGRMEEARSLDAVLHAGTADGA